MSFLPARAALVTPLSGPYAAYGQAGAHALRLWADAGGAAGLLPRPGTAGGLARGAPGPVVLTVFDAHPDPAAAWAAAEATGPDLLFGPYGSGPARAVAAVASRLWWNHGGAQPGSGPAGRVDVLAPAPTYHVGALRALVAADPSLRSVTVVHGTSGFGRAVGEGALAEAARLGLAGVAVPLASGDAVGLAAASSDAAGGVLLVAGSFEQELAVARETLPGRWRAAAFVGAGVEEVLAGLGERREGLLGPAQWLAPGPEAPAPDDGPPAAAFERAYRARTGGPPPYPAVQAYAAGVIAARCVRDAGSADDAAVLAAAGVLDTTTLLGRFRLDPASGEQVGHQVVTVQWQDGLRVAVWPPERARAAVRLR